MPRLGCQGWPSALSWSSEKSPDGGPETLLLGAVEFCKLLTFLAMACRKGVQCSAYRGSAVGTLASDVEGLIRFTHVTIRPVVQVKSPEDEQAVRAIFQDVPKRCFIGASLKAEPLIELTVAVATRPERLLLLRPSR